MALLLTQNDLRLLVDGPRFPYDAFEVIEHALLREHGADLGHALFLKFPLGAEDHAVQLYPLSSPLHGCFVRMSPFSEGPRPTADADVALHLDRETGQVLALIATDDLTPWRTAAPVGVACKLLAPARACVLALIGSGLQARYQLRAIQAAVPTLDTVRVFSPTPAHRDRFAREMGARTGLLIRAVDTARDAVEGADVVCVTAGGRAPVIETLWVRPGALVTTVNPAAVPPDLPARLAVPAREGPAVRPSAWEPHPPYPMSANGAIDPTTIRVTLADMLRGAAPARERDDETVLYAQRGAGAWDAALLHWVYTWALEHQVGTVFHFTAG